MVFVSRPRAVRGLLTLALVVAAAATVAPTAHANGPGSGNVTKVWTDFGGLWDSTDTAEPNVAHHLLAFEVGGTTYSTGVADSTLTTDGITYTPGNWQALPVEGMPDAPGHANYIVIRGGSAQASGFNGTLTSADVSSFLTRGTQGLDLASGVANIPSGTVLSFNLPSITASAIADGVPDILITQIANPDPNRRDSLRFVDADGNQVGSSIEINQNLITPVDNRNTWRARYWTVPGNTLATVSADNTNLNGPGVSSGLRLRAFELEDFGLTADNIGDVRRLLWAAGGSSDPAFFAYNAGSIDVVADSVTVGSASVTLTAIADRRVADGQVTASATSSASLAITFATSDATVCVVDSVGVITPVASGTCTITASTAAQTVASTFYPAASTTTSFSVLAALPEPDSGSGSGPASSAPSTPSFVLRGGSTPALPAGQGEFQHQDGSVVPLAVTSSSSGTVLYRTEGFALTLSGESTSDLAAGLVAGAQGFIECEICASMAAGSVIEVWMFSEPRLVAAWEVLDAPCQRFLIPIGTPLDGGPSVMSGSHTLQFVLPTGSGRQAVNVGMSVSGPVPTSIPAGSGQAPLPGARLSVLLLALTLAGVASGLRSRRASEGSAGPGASISA